jgi:hypothetical protein
MELTRSALSIEAHGAKQAFFTPEMLATIGQVGSRIGQIGCGI